MRVALAAERTLAALDGAAGNRAARDAHSVMHWPMIAGIVLLALGVTKTMTMVGTEPFDLSGAIKPVAAVSLAGGVAPYLIGHPLLRRRMDLSWSQPRAVAAAARAGIVVAAPFVPTMAVLVAVTAVVVALVNHE